MRIFLAGATGALGQRLVPMLVEAGHHVTGSTRTEAKEAALKEAGAEVAVMAPLDEQSVRRAVAASRPDVVIHQLTALSNAAMNLRRFDQEFAETNRLRTTGLDLLVAAAREAGAQRFIAQSFTGWPNERTGGPVKDENDPIDPHPTRPTVQTLAAIRHIDETVPALDDLAGLVLRYGLFYGHGTGFTSEQMLDLVRKRRFPVVGDGSGVASFVHIDDAARATLLAVTEGEPGLYNIVDDDPAPVSEWLPGLADAVGAKPPRHLPTWLARPMIGEQGISMMTQTRGSSNAKAKRVLGWRPAYSSWRQGFREGR
ncbi:MAG TPA: NAD(P)-dependent oxidoreductase [Kribbellaceae bacterium]|nr:NAD(P)-dependent oxidoreductase [Kribbellaceae bacterium]